ncbi:MAG: TFIIB-type zinc ribbon-containing protein [Acidilobus sp.]
MRCPVCGSTRLAWSDELGYLVCQDCGTIISELIDDEAPYTSASEVSKRRRATAPKAPPPTSWTLEEVVEDAARTAVGRGKVLEVVGRSVRLRPPVSRKPEGIDELLEVMRGFPDLRSRTERVRAAIAVYAALKSMGVSRTRAIDMASRASGASPKSLAKVIERHRRSMAKYEEAVASLARESFVAFDRHEEALKSFRAKA